jgi:glycolate oxidase FAD binding subunit
MDTALQALADRVAAARAHRTPLHIQGGGTKAHLGEAPATGGSAGEPLRTDGLRGIVAYEPSELVVTVRAGTPLAELEAALAERGQQLAFEPPRLGRNAPTGGTVGGMVAAGLSGPARASAGSLRDYVLGVSLLDGRGEQLRFGGQVMKNVAGYDISRLLAGSWGVLGVITDVSLKVLPRPPACATLRFEWPQEQALQQLACWGAQPLPISAGAWLDGMLWLRLCGATAAVQQAAQALGGSPVSDTDAAALWNSLRDQRHAYFEQARVRAAADSATLWRLSVPATAGVLALGGPTLLEWGGAQRWVLTDAPAAAVQQAAQACGGHAQAFLGPRPAGSWAALSPELLALHRAVKAAFDPEGLFNPGRLHPQI